MSRFYVAGPMRGYDRFNFPAFDRAAALLRAQGHHVESPAEHDRDCGFDETLNTLDGFDMAAAFRWDASVIANEVDGIVLLPGWEASTGARLERQLAEMCGRSVYLIDLDTGDLAKATDSTWLDAPADRRTGAAPIVGLSGYARAGKDTVGGLLVQRHGFTRVGFADKVRDVLYALDPVVVLHEHSRTESIGYGSVRRLVDWLGWEGAKAEAARSDHGVRALLQRVGTEAGRRVLGEDVWVRAAMDGLEPGGRFVFTDVRFPNEAQAIVDAGGVVVRVERPGCSPVNGHASETALDGWSFDHAIANDGTLDDLAREVDRLAEEVVSCPTA